MISSIPHEPTNPWSLPAHSDIDSYGEQMPLSLAKLAYQSIQSASESLVTLVMTNGTTSSPITSPSNDLLNQVLPSNEIIQEIMSLDERPWDDSHHRILISNLDVIPIQNLSFDTPDIVPLLYTTIQTLDSKGNMGTISNKFLIDISVKTNIVKNMHIGIDCNPEEIASFTCLFKEFHDVCAWSYEEIPDIDPSIVEYEIKVYDNGRKRNRLGSRVN